MTGCTARWNTRCSEVPVGMWLRMRIGSWEFLLVYNVPIRMVVWRWCATERGTPFIVHRSHMCVFANTKSTHRVILSETLRINKTSELTGVQFTASVCSFQSLKFERRPKQSKAVQSRPKPSSTGSASVAAVSTLMLFHRQLDSLTCSSCWCLTILARRC